MRGAAAARGHFLQAVRIRTVRGADDEHQVNVARDLLHRLLSIVCRVADILEFRSPQAGIALSERGNEVARIVDAERRLRDVRDGRTGRHRQPLDVEHVRHHVNGLRHLADSADDFVVAGMANEHYRQALAHEALHLQVHLGNQRTRRVDDLEVAAARFALDRRSDAVSAEDGYGTARYRGYVVDEDRSLALEVTHDVTVVHDLVEDIHGRTMDRERAFDNLDRARHARTEPSGPCEHDLHQEPPRPIAAAAAESRAAAAAARSASDGPVVAVAPPATAAAGSTTTGGGGGGGGRMRASSGWFGNMLTPLSGFAWPWWHVVQLTFATSPVGPLLDAGNTSVSGTR